MNNRQIKFRVWDITDNKYLASYADNGETFHYNGNFTGVDWFIQCSRLEQPKRFVVQQYTGLKDIYGIEIYEGDILSEDWCVVIFKYGAFGYNIPGYVDNFIWLNELNDHFIKVIGNIFETEIKEN